MGYKIASITLILVLTVGNFGYNFDLLKGNKLVSISTYPYFTLIESVITTSYILMVSVIKVMKYSGYPFLSLKKETALKSVSRILLFLLLSRVIDIAASLIWIESFAIFSMGTLEFINLINNDDNVGLAFHVYFISNLVLTEILPGIHVLDRGFIVQFRTSIEEEKSSIISSDNPHSIEEPLVCTEGFPQPTHALMEREVCSLPNKNQKMDDCELMRRLNYSNKHFNNLELMQIVPIKYHREIQERPLSLGSYYFGSYKGFILKIRKLSISSISTFIQRGISKEAKFWRDFKYSAHIEPILGFTIHNDQTYLICEGNPQMISLSQAISQNRINGLFLKLKVIRSIAKIMQRLASLNCYHGHLCPNNIICSDLFTNMKITDWGFHFLKKYVSLLGKYSNKDQFTPPETLKRKGHTSDNPTQAADIYSFGFVVW